MRTTINKEIEQFFSNTKLEEISIQTIKKHFGDIYKVNDYGGLIHASIHNKYPEDKVLKFIEILLENGVNPNLKGKNTGYSYIHLALYGYTEETRDHSYQTDFIVKLINLGKKYNLDVGIKDDDGDSIIHASLASEVYTGNIIELVRALGAGYDILCKDNNGNNIYQALLSYEKEAKSCQEDSWLDNLKKNEKDIKMLVEKEEKCIITSENIQEKEITEKKDIINDEEIFTLIRKIKSLSANTSINYLLKNYPEIIEIRNKVASYSQKKDQQLTRINHEIVNAWAVCDESLKTIFFNYITELSSNPNFQKIQELSPVFDIFGYEELKEELENLKREYQTRIEKIKNKILNSNTLEEIIELKKELLLFTKEKVTLELYELLDKKYAVFTDQISKIQELLEVFKILIAWLNNNNVNNTDNMPEKNFSAMTLDELKNYEEELMKIITNNKILVKQALQDKISELLESIQQLDASNIFKANELLELMTNMLDNKIVKEKIKKGE